MINYRNYDQRYKNSENENSENLVQKYATFNTSDLKPINSQVELSNFMFIPDKIVEELLYNLDYKKSEYQNLTCQCYYGVKIDSIEYKLTDLSENVQFFNCSNYSLDDKRNCVLQFRNFYDVDSDSSSYYFYQKSYSTLCNPFLTKCFDPEVGYSDSAFNFVKRYTVEPVDLIRYETTKLKNNTSFSNSTSTPALRKSRSTGKVAKYKMDFTKKYTWTEWSDCSHSCVPRHHPLNSKPEDPGYPKRFRYQIQEHFFFGIQKSSQDRIRNYHPERVNHECDYYAETLFSSDVDLNSLVESKCVRNIYRNYTYEEKPCEEADLAPVGSIDLDLDSQVMCHYTNALIQNDNNFLDNSILKCQSENDNFYTNLIWPETFIYKEARINCTFGYAARQCTYNCDRAICDLFNLKLNRDGCCAIWEYSTNSTESVNLKSQNSEASGNLEFLINYEACSKFSILDDPAIKDKTLQQVLSSPFEPESPGDVVQVVDFLSEVFSTSSDLPSKIEDLMVLNYHFDHVKWEQTFDIYDTSPIKDLENNFDFKDRKKRQMFRKRRSADSNPDQNQQNMNTTLAFNFNDLIYLTKQLEIVLKSDSIWSKFNSQDAKIKLSEKMLHLIRNFALYLFYVDYNRNMTSLDYISPIFPDTNFEMLDDNIVQVDYFISNRKESCYELNLKININEINKFMNLKLNLVFDFTEFTFSSCSYSEYFYLDKDYIVMFEGEKINSEFKNQDNYKCVNWNQELIK